MTLLGLHRARQQGSQLLQRPGVEQVALLQPPASGLADPVPEHAHPLDAMGVAVDADEDTLTLGRLAVDVEEIEPLGMGIELEVAPALAGVADNRSRARYAHG